MTTSQPAHVSKGELTVLSLGAGVQSSALLIGSAEGIFPKLDAAIFADTGWEPQAVYDHLDRLEREVAIPAGIPIYRVSVGNIRADALAADRSKVGQGARVRFATMPLHTLSADGKKGMGMRLCTGEYKVKPVTRKIKDLLGAPVDETGKIGRAPKGAWLTQWIGISTDEFQRAKDSGIGYIRNQFPLLDANCSRNTCIAYLNDRGWGSTPKSACIGCPFHGNATWSNMRDNDPVSWADAVEFDNAIRDIKPDKGTQYLHASFAPLTEADLDRVTRKEAKALHPVLFEEQPFTCSPFSCEGDELAPQIAAMLAEDETNE